MVVLKGSSLLVRRRCAGPCAGASRYFRMVCQPMRRWRSIFTDGPALGRVQTIQVVDLFGREHGATPFIRRKPNRCQNVVVGKMLKAHADQPDLCGGTF